MPHNTLPPVPVGLVGPDSSGRTADLASRYIDTSRYLETAGRNTSSDPAEDSLLQLRAALASGKMSEDQIQALTNRTIDIHKKSLGERFFGALRAAGLPFEDFTETINSLIGGVVPQEKFQERSARSRAVIKAAFGGDMSIAEAAGALRDIYEERSGWEQFLTGLVFDPLNLLIPGSAGISAGVRAAAEGGARAAVAAGSKAAARKYLEWQLPFVGGKVAGKLGLEAAERLAREASAAVATPDDIARSRIERLISQHQTSGGSGDFEPLLSQATPSEQSVLRSAMGRFYAAVDNPEQFADVPGMDKLVSMYKSTVGPQEQALFQLTLETAGRGFEPSWSRVEDIIWSDNRVLLRAKSREPGAARLSPPLTDQTMDLLRQVVAGKAPTDPIFTKADLGLAGKKGEPVGAAYNGWLAGLGERAGLGEQTLLKGQTIRNLVASAYRGLLERGGAPVTLTRHLLGHADERLFTSYTAKAGEAQINLSMKRFMNDAEEFVPLSVSQARTQTAAKAVAAEVRAAPEFKDIISRKGKGAKQVAKSEQGILGEAKLDALEITNPETWAPRLAGIKSAAKHDLVLDSLRAVEAQRTIFELEQAEEGAKLVQEVLGKTNPMGVRMHKFALAAFKERETLARGLLGRLTHEIGPRLDEVRSTLHSLESSGLMSGTDISDFMERLRTLDHTVKATLETTRAGFIPVRTSVAVKALKAMNMTSADTAEMFRLSGIEKADLASGKAAVSEWLDNDKVRKLLHVMGILTVEKEVDGVKRWVVQSGPAALVTKLHRMAQSGSTTRHILGADLVRSPSEGGLNESARQLRAEVLANYITLTGRLDSHDYLIAKAGKGVVKPLGLSDEEIEAAMSGESPTGLRRASNQQSYEEPFLRRSGSREEMAKGLMPDVSVERSVNQNIRGNPVVSGIVDTMERNAAAGNFTLLNDIGTNVIKLVTLPGASYGLAKGAPRRVFGRYVAGWRDTVMQISAFRSVARAEIINKMPGYKALMVEKMIDPRARIPWFSEALEMEEGFMSTHEWKNLVGAFANTLEDAFAPLMVRGSGLKSDSERLAFNALHNPAVLFGSLPAYGLKPIPLERLSKIYKLSQDELEFVGLVREMNRTATRYALSRVGEAEVKKVLGKQPSSDYVARVAAKVGKEVKNKPPVEARGLREPGVWSKERKIGDAADAWKQQVLYESPFESSLDYLSDMHRVVADRQFIELLKQEGLFEKSRTHWVTQLTASRTLLGLGQAIQEGRLPNVAAEYIAKLKGYADSNLMLDELTRHMGKLATDLIESPERVDEIMGDVLKDVKQADANFRYTTELHAKTSGLPGFGRLWTADSEVARQAVQFFGKQNEALTKWLRGLNHVSSAMRMMQAGIDVSFLAIQGLLLPAFGVTRGFVGASAWKQAAEEAFRSVGNMNHFTTYMGDAKNAAAIKEFVQNTGVWTVPNELMEEVSSVAKIYEVTGSAITSVIGKPELGGAIKNLPIAAERMFTTYLLRSRLELWKSLRPLAGENPDKIRQLATFVNKMTGVYNPATAGVTATQRYFEGTFLSFAPMYRRAAYGLLVDVFRGSPGGNRLDANLALEALTSLAVAAGSVAYMAKASGNNPDALDPGSAKFMSFKVGDSYIGVGSAYYSLVRAVYSVAEQGLDPERRSKLLSIWNVRDNQLSRWWRSQAPPIPQGALDIILGQSYIGEPLRGEDGGITADAFGNWFLGQVSPMAIESIYREVRGVSDAPVVLGESFGLRTFPLSKRDEFRRMADNLLLTSPDPEVSAWRDETDKAGKPLMFDQAPGLVRDRLMRLYPQLQTAQNDVNKDTLLRGKSDERERLQFFEQSKKNKDYVRSLMESAVKEFAVTKDSKVFKDAVSGAQEVNRALSERLGDQFPDVRNWLDKLKQTRASAATSFIGDLMYDKFYSNVVFNKLTEDDNGNFLPSVYQDLITHFKKENGLEWWDYVQKRRKEANQYPSLVEEFFSAKDALRPYWELPQTIWGPYSEEAQLIEEYRGAPPSVQQRMEDRIPRLRMALSALRIQRERYRDQNPEIDWLLTKWYGNSPRTRLARERLAQWLTY